MANPTGALTAVRASTAALVQGIAAEQWTDADVRERSLLPDWTRAHVLTHLARNADGIARTMSGALRGEIVARYPDGQDGRNRDIEVGAARGSLELAADVRDSADRLDRVFGAVADADAWDLPTEDRSCGEYLLARWREVEVHRVDLNGSYTPADWPPEFISYLLPELAETVSGRSAQPVRISVLADGSVTTDQRGREWATDAPGEAVEVRGPDWAVLAWLVGRPAPAAGNLTATPELNRWI